MYSAPHFSVVIPTYNRQPVLAQTLRALEAQEAAPAFEVIVVDDGSTDDTGVWLRDQQYAFPFRVLTQSNRGPAAARNAGVRAAAGAYVAFLGDDTVPASNWLAAHHGAHATRDKTGPLAVLGYTAWHSDLNVTPFLRYLNEQGLQFGYALIEDVEAVPFNFFYTSNLSVPRRLLVEQSFDEAFPYAAWEDIELGYRLTQQGLRLVYTAEAVTHHLHSIRFVDFAQRQQRAGEAAVVFYRKHPALGGFLGLGPEGPPRMPAPWMRKVLYRVAAWSAQGPAWWAPLWKTALRVRYLEGLHRGWKAGTVPALPDAH